MSLDRIRAIMAANEKTFQALGPAQSLLQMLNSTYDVGGLRKIGEVQRALQNQVLAFQLEQREAFARATLPFAHPAYLNLPKDFIDFARRHKELVANFGYEYRSFNFEYPLSFEDDFNVENEKNTLIKEKEQSSIIVGDTKRIQTIITDIHLNKEQIFTLRAREFEEVIAELFRKKNFEVQLTKQTRDGGYDIIAIQDLGGFKNRYLIECKRYESRPVGIDIIRSFMDVVQQKKANKGIICTTSYFSPEAKMRSDSTPYILELKDRLDIMAWVDEYAKRNYISGF